MDPGIRNGYKTRRSFSLLTPEHIKAVAPCRNDSGLANMLILLMRVNWYFIELPGVAGWTGRCDKIGFIVRHYLRILKRVTAVAK